MAFNGVGVFNRLYSWVTDAANAVFIDATRMDNEMNGMATGLTNCITRDGQSVPTANIPMGGFKITGLANGVAATDAATVGQLSTAAAYFDVGNSGAGVTIDFATNGPQQKVTLTNNTTLTLSNGGATPIVARLRVIQDGTGGRTITWAGANYSSGRWINNNLAPTLSGLASGTEYVDFYWDGSVWWQYHLGAINRRPQYTTRAVSSAGTQTIGAGATATVLAAPVLDTYGEWHASSGVFTAKVAGLYRLEGIIRFVPTTCGNNVQIVCYGAGTSTTNTIFFPTSYNGQTLCMYGTYTASLAVGDTMYIECQNLTSANVVLQTNTCVLQVTRLGDAA